MIELLPIDKIKPSKANERKKLTDLDGLLRSIEEVGILQRPTVVADGSGSYTIRHGHRRVAAARMAGLSHVECDVDEAKDASEERVRRLTENMHREDLSPIEEAEGFAALVLEGLSQGGIAKKLGVSQPHVSKRLSLLRLPKKVRDEIHSGGMTASLALELVPLAATPGAVEGVIDLVEKGWDVDQATRRVKRTHEIAEARGRAVAEAEAKKIKVVDPPRHGDKTKWVGTTYGDLNVKGHETHKCHALAFEHGQSTDLRPVCTKPANHPEAKTVTSSRRASAGGSLTEDEKAARKATRERNKTMKAAAPRRVEFMERMLRGRPVKLADVVDLASRQIVQSYQPLGHFTHQATALLGVAKRFEDYCDESPTNATRGLLALCFALGEHSGLENHILEGQITLNHYEWLVDHGYKPAKEEAAEVAAARKRRRR